MLDNPEQVAAISAETSRVTRLFAILRNGVFGTGWLLAIGLFALQQGPLRERPHLVLESNGSTLVAPESIKQTGLKVLWNGRPINNAVLYSVRVRNRGKSSIMSQNFSRPLTFAFKAPAQVADARIADNSESGPTPHIRFAGGSVYISNIALDRGDSFTMEACVLGALSRDITQAAVATGYVMGDGDLGARLVDRSSESHSVLNWVPLLSVLMIVVYLVWLGAIIAIGVRQRRLVAQLKFARGNLQDAGEGLQSMVSRFDLHCQQEEALAGRAMRECEDAVQHLKNGATTEALEKVVTARSLLREWNLGEEGQKKTASTTASQEPARD